MARPYAAEAFAGAGLLGLGFEIEGFDVAESCELERGAVETLKLNWPGAQKIVRCDADTWEPHVPAGGIEVMLGGPPCQPFSTAGKKLGDADPRHKYPLVLKWAKKYQPKYMVWENVSTILTNPKFAPWRIDWWKKIRRLGYDGVAWNLLAADYGTPQARGRAFFVLWRKGDKRAAEMLSEPPPPTHARPALAEELGLPRWVTGFHRLNDGCCGGYGLYSCLLLNNDGNACASCIQGSMYVPGLNETWGDELPEATLDYILRDPARITQKHIPADMSGTMAPLPRRWLLAPTMTANMRKGASYSLVIDPAAVVHTKDDLHELVSQQREHGTPGVRRLSVREAAKLQDVPQWYLFGGSMTSQYRQVGNGVPVNLARAVARQLLRAMGRRVSKNAIARDPEGALWPLDPSDAPCRDAFLRLQRLRGRRMAQMELLPLRRRG